MDKLVLFNANDINLLVKTRSHETKFGEQIQILPNFTNIYDDLVDLDVDYVILGIKEDVGVFANHGKPGTTMAWDATIKVLLNIQSNTITSPKRVLILGYIDYSKASRKLNSLKQGTKKDIQKARRKVEKIDHNVSHLVHQIVKAGKKPIIIGGGHNNAYGNIKGTSLALKKRIHAINLDAHSGFKPEEGRHSGNGFSYAYAEGFLKNYFMFGLQENYNSETIFKTINKLKSLSYNTYEALIVRKEIDINSELERGLNHVCTAPFGIEISCNAIDKIPSSTITPNGFDSTFIKGFVNHFAKHPNASYLHICDASPTPITEIQVGKLVTTLITEFIKS